VRRPGGGRLRRWTGVLATVVLTAVRVTEGVGAQLPPPEPHPFAISFGTALVVPAGDLALADPDQGQYAVAGMALTQRLAWSPWRRLGFFVQASFPIFGLDVDRAQADYGGSPPITDGSSDLAAWNLGLRWQVGSGEPSGPYAEAAGGWHRNTFGLSFTGLDTTIAYDWEPGWALGVGWVLPVSTSFGLDLGVVWHEFKETGFLDRWFAFRALATFAFGGDR